MEILVYMRRAGADIYIKRVRENGGSVRMCVYDGLGVLCKTGEQQPKPKVKRVRYVSICVSDESKSETGHWAGV